MWSCYQIWSLLKRKYKKCFKLYLHFKNKTGGIDGINSSVLKYCVKGVVEPLCGILRTYFLTAVIPDYWKCANIAVIFKLGSKKEVFSYRHTSLTSHVCKVMQRIIKNYIV